MDPVSFYGRARAADREAVPTANGYGDLLGARPARPRRLSGRPFCRIYPLGKGWALELERASAWLVGALVPGDYRFFRSLTAAIGYAEAHGFDYQIVRPTAFFAARRGQGPSSRLR